MRESASLFPFQTANRHAVRKGNREEDSHNNRLRPEKVPLKCFRTGVQLPPPPPYGILRLFEHPLSDTQKASVFLMVEVGGVEPPSESTLTGLSPGADGYCGSLPPCSPSSRQAVTSASQVRVMMRGTVNSFRTHGRHINDAFPGLWPLRFKRLPLIRQQ